MYVCLQGPQDKRIKCDKLRYDGETLWVLNVNGISLIIIFNILW